MNRKHLVHRTIAPRLSELLNEAYDLLKMATPEAIHFAVLFYDNGEEIQTRIIPMGDGDVKEIFDVTEKTVRYIAHTDEDNNFVRGEER